MFHCRNNYIRLYLDAQLYLDATGTLNLRYFTPKKAIKKPFTLSLVNGFLIAFPGSIVFYCLEFSNTFPDQGVPFFFF